jgi:hypothetical protein
VPTRGTCSRHHVAGAPYLDQDDSSGSVYSGCPSSPQVRRGAAAQPQVTGQGPRRSRRGDPRPELRRTYAAATPRPSCAWSCPTTSRCRTTRQRPRSGKQLQKGGYCYYRVDRSGLAQRYILSGDPLETPGNVGVARGECRGVQAPETFLRGNATTQLRRT